MFREDHLIVSHNLDLWLENLNKIRSWDHLSVIQVFTFNPDIHRIGQVLSVGVACYFWYICALEACVVVIFPEFHSLTSWSLRLAALLAFTGVYWFVCVRGYERSSRSGAPLSFSAVFKPTIGCPWKAKFSYDHLRANVAKVWAKL